MIRPYRTQITVSVDAFPGPVSAARVTGRYATLAAAISAAQRQNAAIPDETREIAHAGRSVRNRYNHGDPSKWTAD